MSFASRTIYVPFTDEQVAALNDYQKTALQPVSCGNDRHEIFRPAMIATNDGWICSRDNCDYAQKWATEYIINDEPFYGNPYAF